MEKIKIEKLDYTGKGITHINNKIIFIENALPDETLNIELFEVSKHFCKAKIIDFISTSSKRITPICQHYNKCGGCDLQHISYKDEILFKYNKIVELFKRKCNFEKINNIIQSKNAFNYRNKITLKMVNNKLGLYEKNSHNLVPINYCYLVSKNINQIINELNKINLKNINEITIRHSNESMLIINSNDYLTKDFIDLNVDNIIIKNNDKYEIIKGKDYIINTLGDLNYKIYLDSFFQINTSQAINLYNEIIKLGNFKKNETVLDLYCGAGSISLYISNLVKRVIGIEINENAIKAANENKDLNNITNVEFLCQNVNNYNIDFKPTTIIVDPPRNGLDKKTVEIIKNLNSKKLIYVSCNAETLVRDINLLNDTYILENVTPIDMFPRTAHVECVSVLHRKT